MAVNTAGQRPNPFVKAPPTAGHRPGPTRFRGGSLAGKNNVAAESAVTRAAKERVTKGGRAGTAKAKEQIVGGGGIGLKRVEPTFGPLVDGNIPEKIQKAQA